MTLDLLCIGEVMAELRADPEIGFTVGFAGDTFNTAVYGARALADSGTVGFATRLGRDPLSKACLAMARSENLDLSAIRQDSQRNIGIYSVSVDESGERSFHYWRSHSAARQMFSSSGAADTLPKARIIYLSAITLAILPSDARLRLMDWLCKVRRRAGSLVAFDSNYRPQLWDNIETARAAIDELWQISDIALPSIDDEVALFGDSHEDAVIERFARRDWTACAIKRGVRGPLSPRLALDAHPSFPPAPRVVDTTAAGDSFNGGYLAALLQAQDEVSCLRAGHLLASQVVGSPGAIAPKL